MNIQLLPSPDIKHCFKVLTVSELLRQESDNVGPHAELDFWKSRMAKFNGLVEEMRSAEVKAALRCLQVSGSRLVKVLKS